MTTTITKLYKRLREPLNMSQPDLEKFFILGDGFTLVMKDTDLPLCVFKQGNIKFYRADGVRVLFEIDELTGMWVNGLKLTFLGLTGRANFSGAGGTLGTAIAIADQGSTSYDVKITSYGDSSIVGTVGDVTVEKVSGTQFKVYNAGFATNEFYYEVSNP